MKSTIALFLITITLFFLKPRFFELVYNSSWGRLMLIAIIIIITLNSVLLAVILILFIIFLSQNKKKVRFTIEQEKEDHLDNLPMEEIIIKSDKEKNDEEFLFKKHKNINYTSKRKSGVNVIQIGEALRPKSSKNMVVIPNIPNIETIPYYNKSFYHI